MALASIVAAAYVPIVKPFAEDASAVFSLITYGLMLLAGVFGARFIHKEWTRDPLIIDPLDIPPELAATGLHGSVLSQQLYDALVVLQQSVRPDDGQSDTSFVELPRLQLDLQLPGTSWSVRSALRYFKYLIGRPERRLMGEVCRIGKAYQIRLRSAGGGSVEVPVRFHGPGDVQPALLAAAEQALSLINPLDAASVNQSMESRADGYVRTLANLRAHLASPAIDTHQDAYVMWASVLRNLGDDAGMQAKLDLARATPAGQGVNRPEGRLGARYLNFVGSLHREQREFAQAEKCFTLALVADPDNIAAISNLGVLHIDMEDFDAARRWFERTVRQDGRSSRGHRGLGLVADRIGDLRAAVAHLNRAIDLAPRARWARINLCEVLRRLGRPDEAEQLADALQAMDPNFSPQYRCRARIHQYRGQLSRAQHHIQRAIALDPRDPWPRIHQAQIALDQGDTELAMSASRETRRLAPQLIESHRLMALALQQLGRFKEALNELEEGLARGEDIWARLDQAEILRRSGDMATSFQALENAAKHWPDRADVWRRLATWHRIQEHWAQAETCLWTAVRVAPRDVWSWCELADLQRRLGQLDNAELSLNHALEAWASPSRVLRVRAQLALARLDTGAAEACLRDAITQQPEYLPSRVDLIELLARQDRVPEALTLCDPGEIESMAASDLMRPAVRLLHDSGAFAQADRRMADALSAAPHVLANWLAHSRQCLRSWRVAEARQAALTATERWPGEPEAWTVLGQACATGNDLQGTHEAFGKALALAPDAEWIAGSYITALWRHECEALRAAQTLIAKRPQALAARLRAADLLIELGRPAEAMPYLDAALAQSPSWDEHAAMRRAELRLAMRDAAGCLDDAKAILARSPRGPQAPRMLRVLAQAERGQHPEQAEAHLRAALELDPLDAETWLALAKLQPSAAQERATLEEALRRHPHAVRLRRELVTRCKRDGDTPRVRSLIDELVALRPFEIQDLLAWSRLVFEMDMPNAEREAHRAVRTAQARQADHASVWLRHAELLKDEGDIESAMAAGLRALSAATQPAVPAMMLEVALLLAHLGATTLARIETERAVALQPGRDARVMSSAARVYQNLHDWPRCVACLEIACELRPDERWFWDRLEKAREAEGDDAAHSSAANKKPK